MTKNWRKNKKGNIGNQNDSKTKKKISEKNKGNIPWNKNLTKDIDDRVRKYGEKRKEKIEYIKIECKYCGKIKNYQKCLNINRKYCSIKCAYKNKIGQLTWNKNLTKENDKRIMNQSKKLKEWHKENPEHGIKLSYAGYMKQREKGFISKPQMELYLLIKEKYPEAELEYPIKTNQSIRFADIAIPSLNLDIEYDGLFWHKNKQLDNLRDKHLKEVGWKTIRFNKDNIKEVNKIMELK